MIEYLANIFNYIERQNINPSFFEITTALALRYFED